MLLFGYLAHEVPLGGDERRGDELGANVALAQGFLVKPRHSRRVRLRWIPNSGTGPAYYPGLSISICEGAEKGKLGLVALAGSAGSEIALKPRLRLALRWLES